MTQATPVTFGLSGTPVIDAGASGTLVEPVTAGNATPVVLSINSNAMPVNLSLIPEPSEAVAWFDQVVTNGGTVSSLQRIRVSLLVSSLVASGAWALTDDIWLLAAESSIQALTSLKQLRLATAVDGPSYVAGQSFVFNGTSQCVNTGFIPNTHATQMTTNNVRYSHYLLNDPNSTTAVGSVVSSSNRRILMTPRNSTSGLLAGSTNSTTSTWNLPRPTAIGMAVVGRNGAAGSDSYAYKNGVALTRVGTAAALGASLPNLALYIGATNDSASGVINFNTYRTAWMTVGATLSAAQEIAVYSAVKAYLLSWGVTQ